MPDQSRFLEFHIRGKTYYLDLLTFTVYTLAFALTVYALSGLIPQCASPTLCPPAIGPERTITEAFFSTAHIIFYALFLIAILAIPPLLTENSWKVLDKLAEHPEGMTTWQIMKACKMPERTAQRAVRATRALYLRSIGISPKGGSIYILSDYGKEEASKPDRKVTHQKSVGKAYNPTEDPQNTPNQASPKNKLNSDH